MKEALIEYNPWWTSSKVEAEKVGIKRPYYLSKLLKNLDRREIVKVIGIRRSGKTTLMYQLINELLRRGVNPKSIFYVQLDDARFTQEDKENIIQKIVSAYEELTEVNIKKTRAYFLLDEIQHAKNWEAWLKTYYENYPKIKFVVSGSSSTIIRKRAADKLIGREIDLPIYPLSFSEFLEFGKFEPPKPLPFSKLKISELEKFEILSKEREITKRFNQYLKKGGFPQIFSIREGWKEMLQNYFLDTIYRDVVRVYGIREPTILENLAVYFFRYIGRKFNFSRLARYFGTTTDTVIDYWKYLVNSGLFFEVKPFSRSFKITIRKERKPYCIDPGLMNALVFESEKSFLLENVVFLTLIRNFDKVFYWDGKNECDFVAQKGERLLPVEVKQGDAIDSSGVREFMEKFGAKRGLVVTRTLAAEKPGPRANTKIFAIPARFLDFIDYNR